LLCFFSQRNNCTYVGRQGTFIGAYSSYLVNPTRVELDFSGFDSTWKVGRLPGAESTSKYFHEMKPIRKWKIFHFKLAAKATELKKYVYLKIFPSVLVRLKMKA
jgi:hypothetical protein